jgi:hypothetical protein
MDQDACGLMALVAYSKTSRTMHDNPTESLYDTSYKRKTHTQFTYISVPFTMVRANKLFAGFSKAKVGDFIGECYLEFSCSSFDAANIYKSIKSCTFCMGNHVLETLTGKTLDIMAHVFKNNKPEIETTKENKYRVMIPLPFFFTHSTRTHLPIVETLRKYDKKEYVFTENMHIDVVLSDADICDLTLVCKTIYLDSNERNSFLQDLIYKKHSILSCPLHTMSIELPGNCDCHTLTLPPIASVLDMFIKIDGDSLALATINVVLNGFVHMSLTRLMATRLLPRQLYGIDNNDPGWYIIPFCQDPSHTNTFTSSVSLDRIDVAQLVLKFDKALTKNTNVTIVMRHWDTLTFTNGMIKWL